MTRTKLLATTFLLIGFIPLVAIAEDGLTAEKAFEQMKHMAGDWKGTTSGDVPGHTSIRLTAGGTTVVETEFPGTDHEMMSMYYLDGQRLVRKHHCSMGNQPEMSLDLKKSTTAKLVFAFAGGTNLNAETDAHVHDGQIAFKPDGSVHTAWSYYENGKHAGINEMFLKKQ